MFSNIKKEEEKHKYIYTYVDISSLLTSVRYSLYIEFAQIYTFICEIFKYYANLAL